MYGSRPQAKLPPAVGTPTFGSFGGNRADVAHASRDDAGAALQPCCSFEKWEKPVCVSAITNLAKIVAPPIHGLARFQQGAGVLTPGSKSSYELTCQAVHFSWWTAMEKDLNAQHH